MFPRIVRVRQHFAGPRIDNLEQKVADEFAHIGLAAQIRPDMKIGITVGSRGISNIARMVKAVCDELKRLGARPFLIPAMGSHGGATAEGQVKVLESLGVTEAACGAPILSSMETDVIGRTQDGLEVCCDRNALSMDCILLMGRIKRHTDFHTSIGFESGLMKMAAIGLGKHKQALMLHSFGVPGIRDMMPRVAEVVLAKTKILCGIGIVENALEQTAILEAIPKEQIKQREPELLRLSLQYMPKLPVEELDLLAVDQIGKNFSGTGMDTNIIGRIRIAGVEEPKSPRIKYVLAGDVSEASGGNVIGIGLADITTRRLFDKIDYQVTNENVLTSTFLHRAMIPMVMNNDKEAVLAIMRSNWGVRPEDLRFMRIPNTLQLEELIVSENLVPEISQLNHIEIISDSEEMVFDEQGYFARQWEV